MFCLFVNSLIKDSYLKKEIYIKNKPNQKIFAMPLNYFMKIFQIYLNSKYLRKTKIINMNKDYKFRTDQLINLIGKILKKNHIVLRIKTNSNFLKNSVFNNNIPKKKNLYFKKETQDLINFVKSYF